jgi:hypothetical protein
LVHDGRTGILVDEFSSPRAWANVLIEICRDPARLRFLASQIRPPQTMDVVARQMLGAYEELLRRKPAVSEHGGGRRTASA